MTSLEISRNSSLGFSPCSGGRPDIRPCSPGKADVLDCDDKRLVHRQNLTFPGPLLSNKMHKEDLIQFIQGKSQECLLHADDPEQRASYFFWNIMDLCCKKNGKVMMVDIATLLFRSYGCLRKKAAELRVDRKRDNWCLDLASLLCAALPKDDLIKAVIDLGDNFATKGLTYAAHICYVVAFKDSGFNLIGCDSLPVGFSAMREAIERTEVYEYVQVLTSGSAHPSFQEFKLLYASSLFESGFSAQALDYCETIARTVATFPDRITNTLFHQLIRLSEKLHEGKGEEPEWLLDLRLLHKEEADLSNSCTEQEQHIEMPEEPSALECYSSRAREHRAFEFITEEVISQYIIGDLLGHGGGGAVYEGFRKADSTEVAVKFFLRDDYQGMMTIPGDTRVLPVEVGLMEMVSEPFRSQYVLELLQWFEIPNYIVLILERPHPCMDLLDFCEVRSGKLPEPLVRDLILQMVQAARHCCDSGVFHNDIKPGNALINTETLQVKLIDFGGGDLLKTTPYTYCPGTPEYHPPEWYNHRRYMGRPTTVWTLGITLYQMLHGDVPFQTREEITNGPLHIGPGLSKDCHELISWCLQKDPKARPNFRQILRHRWSMAGPSYVESFPVLGRLVKLVIKLHDYYVKE